MSPPWDPIQQEKLLELWLGKKKKIDLSVSQNLNDGILQYNPESTYPDSPFYQLVGHFMLEQMHQQVISSDGTVHFIG